MFFLRSVDTRSSVGVRGQIEGGGGVGTSTGMAAEAGRRPIQPTEPVAGHARLHAKPAWAGGRATAATQCGAPLRATHGGSPPFPHLACAPPCHSSWQLQTLQFRQLGRCMRSAGRPLRGAAAGQEASKAPKAAAQPYTTAHAFSRYPPPFPLAGPAIGASGEARVDHATTQRQQKAAWRAEPAQLQKYCATHGSRSPMASSRP